MTTDALTDGLRETLDCFDASGAPLTTSEVADVIGIGRRSTYDRLDRLVERNRLRTKKVGARGRVWWQPRKRSTRGRGTGGGQRDRSETRDADREQFEHLVDAVEEYAICVLDPDGHVRTWNRGAERIKGYPREEILGRHVSTFYTPTDREAGVPDSNLADAERRGSIEDEGWQCRANGTRFWASIAISAVFDGNGELDGFVKVTRDMTERRERSQVVREERNLLGKILETSPVGVAIFDDDRTLVRSNDRANSLLGRGVDLEAGVSDDAAMHLRREDGQPLQREEYPVSRVLASGEAVFGMTCRVEGSDGADRWLSCKAAPVRAGEDVIERVVLTLEDVTQLTRQTRRLERRRDELEAELDEVLERVSDGFFGLDDDCRFTYLNDRTEELMGVDATSVLGADVRDVVDLTDDFESALDEARSRGEPITLEEYVPSLDAWFESTLYPSETGISVAFRDVTDRKQREAELERYEAIIEAIGDPVYELDTEGRFTFVNQALAEQSGYDEDDLLGSHVSIGMNADAVSRTVEEMAALNADDEATSTTVEYEVTTKDDDPVQVENHISLLTDEEGRVRGSAGVLRDITERAARERELEESRNRYRTLIENFPNGAVALVDRDLRYATVGGTPIEDVGVDELAGQPVEEVVSPALAAELLPRYEAAFEGEASAFAVELPDGVFQLRIIPVRNDAGEVFAALGMSQNVTESVERQRELDRQRERLTALDELNGVFRDVTDAVIEQSTRGEIERIVCERLAASDSYCFAWIGDVDVHTETVRLRTEAGVEGYLDGLTISIDADDERSQGPTGRAILTREMQVVRDTATSSSHDPWKDHVAEYDFRASAAIPITHEGSLYGVLNVYADREDAFSADEQAVVGQLGEVIGHAIAAVERKRALLSEEVVELGFRLPDLFDMAGVAAPAEGTITLDRTVPIGDDVYLAYGSATGDATESLQALVDADSLPGWAALRRLEGEGEATSFELRLEEPPVLGAIATAGGYLADARIEDGAYHLQIHLAPTADVRQVVDAIRDVYPGMELVTQRQRTLDRQTTTGLRGQFFETLTDRQRSALEAAYQTGYFEWPRETSGETVADSLGVSPSTFHQHLRKAQNRLLTVLLEEGAG